MPTKESVNEQAKLAQPSAAPEAQLVTLSQDQLNAQIEQSVETMVADRLSRIEHKSDASELGDAIANSMAQVANQGIGKRAPDDVKTLKARAAANKAMHEALKEAIEAGDIPQYRILNNCFLGGTLVEPKSSKGVDTIIQWKKAPNLAMFPDNDSARRVMGFFKKSIATTGADAPTVDAGYDKDYNRDPLKFVAGAPERDAVSDIGRAHAQGDDDGFKIVQGAQVGNGNKLIDVINRVNLR